MDNNINKRNDDQLRNLFSGTKERAGENLKYRIMRQIETETSLSRKNIKEKSSVFSTLFPILGVMYGIVGVILLIVYLLYGSQALLSSSVYIPVLSIVSVCSVYLFISAFDEKRHSRSKSGKKE